MRQCFVVYKTVPAGSALVRFLTKCIIQKLNDPSVIFYIVI